jgi:hypothetical protein
MPEGMSKGIGAILCKLGHFANIFFFIGTTTLSWVLACSTVVEHTQQEGFTECRCQRHVKSPNLEENQGF